MTRRRGFWGRHPVLTIAAGVWVAGVAWTATAAAVVAYAAVPPWEFFGGSS